ncbi:hypothetical protein Tco_0692472 [Tanacetum coccineum]
MASLDRRLNSLYAIKECSSYENLHTKDCGCSIGSLEDKIHVPTLEEVFQDFQDTSKSSDDDTNFVNQEPFVVKQGPGVNSSQSPPQINHNCCYECGDSLDDIFCQRCTFDGRSYLLSGAIDGSEVNEIIQNPKWELESSCFTFDLVPLVVRSVCIAWMIVESLKDEKMYVKFSNNVKAEHRGSYLDVEGIKWETDIREKEEKPRPKVQKELETVLNRTFPDRHDNLCAFEVKKKSKSTPGHGHDQGCRLTGLGSKVN